MKLEIERGDKVHVMVHHMRKEPGRPAEFRHFCLAAKVVEYCGGGEYVLETLQQRPCVLKARLDPTGEALGFHFPGERVGGCCQLVGGEAVPW